MYFIMTSDPTLTKPLKLKVTEQGFEGTEPFVTYSDFDAMTDCADFIMGKKLMTTICCFSNRLKEVMDDYADAREATPFFVVNKEQTDQEVYWHVKYNHMPCLQKKNEGECVKLTLQGTLEPHTYVFEIVFEKQTYLIVSLEVAEGILKHSLEGIQFIPVSIEERS